MSPQGLQGDRLSEFEVSIKLLGSGDVENMWNSQGIPNHGGTKGMAVYKPRAVGMHETARKARVCLGHYGAYGIRGNAKPQIDMR